MKRNGILKAMAVAIVVVASGHGVQAQDDRNAAIEADIQSLPTEGEYAAIRDKLELCVSCHGLSNASPEPGMPVLAGQHQYYVYVQLKDFKAGRRANDTMSPVAADLEKEQMMLIGKFFSEQTWPDLGYRGEDAKVQRGQVAAESGECTACHLGGYEGNSRVPHIAGQQKEYLLKTMMDFKNDVRKNSAAMQDLFGSYSDEDIEATAEFLANY